jgi:hypothetical protein
VLKVDESREEGDGIVQIVNANPKVSGYNAATYGIGSDQTQSVSLSDSFAAEVLWKEEKNLVIMVVNPLMAKGINSVAKKIREAQFKVESFSQSPIFDQTISSIGIAKDLLMNMKVSDAHDNVVSILDNINQ